MSEHATLEQIAFPRTGARARRWMRFERDYLAWLDSPEGRFAAWRAKHEQASALALAEEPQEA